MLPVGVLLPERLLHSSGFEILATFVALNTLMYATLAVLKVLPKGRAPRRSTSRRRDRVGAEAPHRPTGSGVPGRVSRPRGRDRRAADRSIYAGLPAAAVSRSQPAGPRAAASDR
jgi:hypothetical protein